MNPFEYHRATQTEDALHAAEHATSRSQHAKFLAGGTNLVDLMKDHVEQPEVLIDINRLPLRGIEMLPDGGVRLGALARNAETANHPFVRQKYPLLAEAILSGASPQLRNLATNGGNLLQRTRCFYFMDAGFPACNKRIPGSGCGAIHGVNRIHAILGTSGECIATHPSDMCVALAALDAQVRVRGAQGERQISFADFHRLPGDTPQRDTNLGQGELILSIDLPPGEAFAEHSFYLKVRDRASYEFALVSVAAALDLQDGVIREARIALGGVAHKPWRSKEAEQALAGKSASLENFQRAADAALQNARAYRDNGFKIELAKRSIVRALRVAGGVA